MKYIKGTSVLLAIGVSSAFSAGLFAGNGQEPASAPTFKSHNQVHQVSHELAGAVSYGSSGTQGYKWGGEKRGSANDHVWSETNSTASGYKWGQKGVSEASDSFVDNSQYTWDTMSFPSQTGYKWGLRNFADQTGYKWGLRSFADQTGYKWGLRNFAEQTGYKWGRR